MGSRPLLTGLAVSAYECALRNGVFRDAEIAKDLDVDAPAAARLRELLTQLRLLAPGKDGGPPVPVDPLIAEMELRSPVERSIRESQERLAHIHGELRALVPLYQEGSRSGRCDEQIRVLDDPAEVRREVSMLMRTCERETVTVQPGGGRSSESVRRVLAPTLEMLARGVTLRTLYQHTARASLATRAFVRQVAAEGAEVRTTGEAFERVFFFDRRIAVVSQERRGRQPPGATLVSEPTLVDFMYRTFENLWQSARVFDTERVAYPETREELRTDILRLMAAGLKDDVIARRLGMATRTCRRYITELMDEIDASSRFQAGLIVGRRGLLPDEETHGTAGDRTDIVAQGAPHQARYDGSDRP